MDLSKLLDPFPPEDLEFKPVRYNIDAGGKVSVLCYITARAIMDRLDDVVGPENWKASYTHLTSGVMCHLAIRFERDHADVDWVEKSDGAGESDVAPFKGGISGALKRAGNVWGIGRYLYRLGNTRVPARKLKQGEYTPDGWEWTKDFIYERPTLPEWALPTPPPDGKDPPKKSPTGDSGAKGGLPLPPKRSVTLLTGAQLKKIHALRRDIEVSEEAYKSILFTDFGCTTSKDLTKKAATELIDRLERRRKSQLEQEAKETFGDSDADSRMAKLRDSALGFAKGIAYMDGLSVGQREAALKEAGLPVQRIELQEVIAASADEKELEGLVIKLEAVVTSLSF